VALLAGCGSVGRGKGATTGASASQEAASLPAKSDGGAPQARPRDLETYIALVDIDVYKSKVAPAFDRYVSTGETGDAAKLMPGLTLPALDTKQKRLEAALKAAPPVVEAKCLVKLAGIEPYQLGGGELVSYLYSASDWLRETLTAKDISDETLDYPLGEHAEVIRPADAAEIRVNVRNVPTPPDAGIKNQLAALLTMMDAVSRNPHYALALVMK